jgi:hypothetical protein
MNNIFISRRQYGELDKLNEDGPTCQIWQVSGTGLTNSGQSRDRYGSEPTQTTVCASFSRGACVAFKPTYAHYFLLPIFSSSAYGRLTRLACFLADKSQCCFGRESLNWFWQVLVQCVATFLLNLATFGRILVTVPVV